MQFSNQNLGTILALLKQHVDHDIDINWNSDEGIRVKELEDFYLTLKNHMNDLHYNVPKVQCYSNTIFLKGNTDFFIKYIMLNDQSSQLSKEVNQVIKHLNNCYWCFLEYSKIMKQFAIKMNSIDPGGEKNGF